MLREKQERQFIWFLTNAGPVGRQLKASSTFTAVAPRAVDTVSISLAEVVPIAALINVWKTKSSGVRNHSCLRFTHCLCVREETSALHKARAAWPCVLGMHTKKQNHHHSPMSPSGWKRIPQIQLTTHQSHFGNLQHLPKEIFVLKKNFLFAFRLKK